MNVLPEPSPPPAAAGTPQAAPGPPPAASGQPAARLALFRLGGRLCGITSAFCKQFVQLEAVTPVPLAPAHLLGVTQLRGRILPVLDVTLLPGLPEPPEAPKAPIVPEAPQAPLLPELTPLDAAPPAPARPAAESGLPPAPSGMPALVVTATGLDSTMAALKVTEIVGFERPSSAASGPLWRGEEVAVLDVATLLGSLRPGPPDVTPGRREERLP
jgi:hypothetical protein